ncbi:aldo/keto reductase [Natranaerobius thermophilus]|uniref:Aldo/keto reductase n=1 Tax=Natranaerobius thermophilus (strain ATCC BAA-1301 / DSM 18059 / JW/NM-WN-LF) TaxID=457570 RepID=B2A6N8_NATTJ|nr:aldo/keto reductase [Natranaerobius thermophilus]ACB84171.1 aldo/keto reductase [Natranaerobius thermophilus JW/NM-WN-LF]
MTISRRTFLKIGGVVIAGSVIYVINSEIFPEKDQDSSPHYNNLKDNEDSVKLNADKNKDPNPANKEHQNMIPRRKLGKTERSVSLLGLGGGGILAQEGNESQEEIQELIQKAVDNGINFIDTAPTYGPSEENIGTALEGLAIDRSELFIATKTLSRSYDETMKLVEESLNRLKTDYIDLYQIHGINGQEDLEEAFSQDGSIQALEKLKQEGVIKSTGVSGHREPRVLMDALEEYDFDCIMMPLNAGDIHDRPFQTKLLNKARDRNMGIIAMKVMAYGNIFNEEGIRKAEQALSYTCSFPISTAIIGISQINQLEDNIQILKNFSPLENHDLEKLEQLTEHYQDKINHFRDW